MKYFRIDTTFYPLSDIERAYNEGLFIVTRRAVYQINYSQVQQNYWYQVIFNTDIVINGRYCLMDREAVFNLMREQNRL